jgi:hypothetical protein
MMSSAMERMARIRQEMEVEDASGERFGKVTDVRIDAPGAIETGFSPVLGAHQAPNLPEELIGRLQQAGYIKKDETRYFRRDFRYFATPDEIVSVDSTTVRLGKRCRDLITSID